ncbi:hypothetical protein PHYBLDRAFT_158170 [Phycomyces blakesleeanus NRRL 1555(-)]|uniref:Uncharacterized protein n=1 Tax=Phycomyces blakesleeanus (strain ATCC 8743b / DSM 1359 / FGSC 10004 / NBRC 33097 / NRRL 1555) TaxID=763407 RepID=A0A162UK87_PHYB8|nr:hypothetical protein PHYBLDRAFT_158170 [Phycomyces blakesleeanus NRRL 1555(-)]OAD75913.1 hypothetical protein PHYBLDRAFT_158170 [Phycomyces blakesleeanus NRRL 1555(-)]|eukprot:XP_018293953.1 hypothetical protein PHYBLDRAFT_158170 [Phycomyces blakesleeanus NRRL 1555(-)]
MTITNNTVIQLLQHIQDTLTDIQKGQEELKERQDAILTEMASITTSLNALRTPDFFATTSDNVSTGSIPRPVSNIRGITVKHIYKMMAKDLGVKLTKENRTTLQNCTRLACDNLALLPSVQALGPSPSWKSIPQADKKEICANHANTLKEHGIDFTRCHQNWASVARVSHLWKDRYRKATTSEAL